MKKPDLPASEENRLKTLQQYNILDTKSEEDFDFITKLTAAICGVPIAIISLVDKDRQWFKSITGMDGISEAPREFSICGHAILEPTNVFEVENTLVDSRFSDNPMITSTNPPLSFYAGAPLIAPNGEAIGTLCVLDTQPRKLTQEQRESLLGLARQVINLLETKKQNVELKEFKDRTEAWNANTGAVSYSCLNNERFNCLFVSEFIEELTGLSAAELINNPSLGLLDIIYEEDVAYVSNELERQLKTGSNFELSYRIKAKNGAVKWVKDSGKIRKNAVPEVLDGILLDITDKIKTEQFYKTIFETSDSIICIHNEKGDVLHFNPAAAKSLQYSLEDKIPVSIEDFIFKEDIPFLSIYFDALKEQKKIAINLKLRSKTQQSKYWSCQCSCLFEDNTETLYMINAWDITTELKTEKKLKESENLFKIISENLSDILYILDATDGSYKFISPTTKDVLGVEEAYFYEINNFISDFVSESFQEECKKCKSNLANGEGYELEYLVSIKGNNKWLRETVRPVFNNEGNNKLFAGRVTDITERKLYYLELERTKEFLEQTGQLAKVGGWTYDNLTNSLSWTKITYEIHDAPLEYSPNVAEGISFYKEGYSKDTITQKFQELLSQGIGFDLELEIISLTGQPKWVRSIGKPLFLHEKIVGATGVFQDITALKINTLELQKTKEKIESILNELNDMVWSKSYPEQKLLFTTPAATEITGYSIQEFQENPNLFTEIAHPNDLHLLEDIPNLLKMSGFYNKTHRIFSKSGELKWVRNSGRLIKNSYGEAYRLDGKITDISAEVKIQEAINSQMELQGLLMKIATEYINLDVSGSEEKITYSLELIGEFANADRVYIFDYDWKNETCTNTFEWCAKGINPEISKLQGLPLHLFPDWVETHLKKEIIHIADISDLDESDNVKIILESQGVKSLIALPIYFEEEVYGFVGFDYVTHRRDLEDKEISLLLLFTQILANLRNRSVLEENLIIQKERAEQASQYKSQFLANMSHEIRTPLNGVIGFTDLLLKTPLTHVQKQYAENANISGKSLLGIINDILDFSKIEAGKLDLEFIEHDIYEIANSSIDIIKFQASQKLLELILNIPPNLPRIMLLDPIRLKQVLINLLSNAVKFTEEGEVELKIQFEKKSDSHGVLTFEVRDTGIGISDEQQKKLFQAFAQADSSTTRKYGGSGLGLTISNLLVHKMGGQISLESKVDEGSKFEFSFDVQYHALEKNQELVLDIRKVLILDDNANNVTVLEENLKYWKVPFLSTQDPYYALKILESDPTIDLGIIDYHMPGIDGVEVIMKIRNELKITKDKLKLILLHSSTDTELLKNFYKKFDISFGLLKPVKSDELYNFLVNIRNKIIIKEFQEQQESVSKTIINDKTYDILIAEDIDMNMLLIKTLILQQLPMARIFECKNGDIAYKTYKTQPIDLVFMDVQMPKMDGITATKLIRAHEQDVNKRTPIIALTAGALKEEKENCMNAGMDEFLTKPVQSDVLISIIEKYLLHLNEKMEHQTIENNINDPLEMENSPLFDKNELMQLIGHDMDLYRTLMEASMDFDRQIGMLQQALERMDKTEIKSIAHGIKGSAQTMFFTQLHQLVRKIETQISDLTNEELSYFIQEVIKTWEDLRPIIENEIKNHQ